MSNRSSFLRESSEEKASNSIPKPPASGKKPFNPISKPKPKPKPKKTIPKKKPASKDSSVDLLQKFLKTPLIKPKATNETQASNGTISDDSRQEIVNIKRLMNPFYLLGSYPELNSTYQTMVKFHEPNYGLYNDDDYCERVDAYNLLNPDNMLKEKNFFTDYFRGSVPRGWVMDKVGKVPMQQISWTMPKKDQETRKYHLDHTINGFFTSHSGFFNFHKIGEHFNCATQMHNHIPGFGPLVRKDKIIDKFITYAESYKTRPQCFDRTKLFPKAYRLYNEAECKSFFTMVNSTEYKESLQTDPIQYLVKIGVGSHKSEGVFLMESNVTNFLQSHYKNGSECGKENHSLIAQAYVSNPLLLDMNNKFDFRVYLLIASTNPFILYSHDGFIKVALNSYEKGSSDRATHLTNTFLANQKINEAKQKGSKLHGMTEKQLQDYILWDYNKFLKYLLTSGKVTDPNWLDNYLRPAFNKAYIHLIRMTRDSFWKQSNVFQMHGMDFMLDDKMELWFIESNPSPQLSGTAVDKIYHQVFWGIQDIAYSYYRSRMKRVLDVVQRMLKETQENSEMDYKKWRAEYQEAVKNRLEPEYQVSPKNTWTLIMDENLPGADAYMGYISPECI